MTHPHEELAKKLADQWGIAWECHEEQKEDFNPCYCDTGGCVHCCWEDNEGEDVRNQFRGLATVAAAHFENIET